MHGQEALLNLARGAEAQSHFTLRKATQGTSSTQQSEPPRRQLDAPSRHLQGQHGQGPDQGQDQGQGQGRSQGPGRVQGQVQGQTPWWGLKD